ncbi:hypothetical protein [Actinopolymorpha alba]|uniref:hypothetical protein n=1 Tax=Actinopolymorpha alba TaxID=533267 RepID=UPI00036CFEA6|nr:hypothetical protein [Actinopolymorpha alba]
MAVATEQLWAEHATEIACDESGWEGTNLVAGSSEVMAYASVCLSVEAAQASIQALSGRVRSRGLEYKASHLLRAGRQSNVTWLLGAEGPLQGKARVHLTDKTFFVVCRILDVFVGGYVDTASAGLVQDPRLVDMARTLCRVGEDAFGHERWRAFLATSNTVLKRTRRPVVRGPVDAFFAQVDALHRLDGQNQVGEILDVLRQARPTAYDARVHLLESQVLQPALEPLIPAIARTVLHWGSDQQTVTIVHDEQSALTKRRLAGLEQTLASPPVELLRPPGQGQFIHLRQVDSRSEPRVQIADLLAGVARKIATEELHGSSDGEHSALLRSYIDPASHWCHEQSWQRLKPQ